MLTEREYTETSEDIILHDQAIGKGVACDLSGSTTHFPVSAEGRRIGGRSGRATVGNVYPICHHLDGIMRLGRGDYRRYKPHWERGAPLERYVIHIFHRDSEDPKMIAGTVEGAWGEKRKGFLGYDSLWRILSAPPRGSRRRNGVRVEAGLEIPRFTEIVRSISDTEGERLGEETAGARQDIG